MRRIFSLLTAAQLALLAGTAAQAEWRQLGGAAGFASGAYLSLALDGSGKPYLAFSDKANGSKASVMRFNGTDWEQVGGKAVSDGAASSLSLALDGSGTPYLAFSDKTNGGKVRVMQLDDSANWVTVGSPAVSNGDAIDLSLAVDNSGIPSVAYSESGANPWDDAQVSMRTLNGAEWGAFRGADFSVDAASSVSLAMNSSGIPHLVYIYQDVDERDKIGAIKYGGSSWVTMGTAGFAEAAAATQVRLAISIGGVPYVAFSDAADGGKASVMRFTGTGWEKVGGTAASNGEAADISLALSKSGIPYVACSDKTTSGKVSVKKLNGTNWEPVGATDFFPDDADNINLALNSGGTPYLVFSDADNMISAAQFSSITAMPWLDMLLRGK